VALSDLDAIQGTFEGVRQGSTDYFLGDTGTRTTLKTQLTEARAGLAEQMDAHETVTEHPDDVATLRTDADAYLSVTDEQMIPVLDAGNVAATGAAAAGPMVEAQDVVVEDFTGLRAQIREGADEQTAIGSEQAASAKTRLWTILGVSVALGLLFALAVVRQIVRTVRAVQVSVDALAAGDLTVVPEVRSHDELGRMAAALGSHSATCGRCCCRWWTPRMRTTVGRFTY
jgi:methyl-accepting chemotaxis protein